MVEVQPPNRPLFIPRKLCVAPLTRLGAVGTLALVTEFAVELEIFRK